MTDTINLNPFTEGNDYGAPVTIIAPSELSRSDVLIVASDDGLKAVSADAVQQTQPVLFHFSGSLGAAESEGWRPATARVFKAIQVWMGVASSYPVTVKLNINGEPAISVELEAGAKSAAFSITEGLSVDFSNTITLSVSVATGANGSDLSIRLI